MAYPTTLDTFPNATDLFTGTETLLTNPHSVLHGDLGNAIETLQAKVGVDSSAVATSLDFKVATNTTDISTLSSTVSGHTTSISSINSTLGGYGNIVTHNAAEFDTAGAASAAQAAAIAASQPVDSDLTNIAALSTQSFGRSILTQASASAMKTTTKVGYTNRVSGHFNFK